MGLLENASAMLEDMTPANRVFLGGAVPKPGAFDLVGNVPVPLRHRIHDAVDEVASGHIISRGRPLKWTFPHGRGCGAPMDRLRLIRSLADFPHMLVSAEHGNAFNRRFYERHVMGGAFTSGQPDGAPSAFTDCGLIDAQGWIGTYAVAPFVFLIDHARLDGRPAPRRWADLLDPMYRDMVVFSGWRREGELQYSQYNKFFLLAMAKEFGLKGLAKLVANVPLLLHSAQMPRLAGTDASPGGIYIAPWSMADMCPRRKVTEIIWPEDGALAYPLWLTVKASHRNALDPLLRYFYGAELGRYLNANRYPALTPDCPSGLPEGAKLKWLGWDYIRHPATARMIKAASQIFVDHQVMRALSLPGEARLCT
jgi:ABC-type Fe3+ transport system substrate-binding protein